jgi:hypothetical protein
MSGRAFLAQSLELLPAESFAAHQETSDAPPARPEKPQPPGEEPRDVRQATESPVSEAEPLDEEPPGLRRRARELAVGAVTAESKVAAAERSGVPGVLAQQAAQPAAVKRAEGQDELAAAPSGDSSAAALLVMVRMERLPLLAALTVAPAP